MQRSGHLLGIHPPVEVEMARKVVEMVPSIGCADVNSAPRPHERRKAGARL